MKYILLVIIVLICSYVGYGISKYYSRRTKFFQGLVLLFEKIKLEINFSQSKLISILTNFVVSNNDVKTLMQNFQKSLENNQKLCEENLFKGIKILSQEEKNIIMSYFQSLGKFDVLNQSKQIESEISDLRAFQKNAEIEEKKYASLYFKIGIILGLAIALVLL